MEDQEILQEPDIILQNPPEELSIDPPDYYSAATHCRHQHHHHHSPCSSCGCSSHSRKRPSIPSQTTHHPNPAKKLFLDTPPPDHHHYHHHHSAAASLPLRRAASDSFAASGPGISSNASPAPANLSPTPGSASDSSRGGRPPLPPTLRRCVSDPIPSPPPQPESKSRSRTSSSSAEDSDKNTPSSKRSKMLSSWREFNRYMEQELVAVERQTEDVSRTTNTEYHYENDSNENKDNGLGRTTNKEDSMAEFEESLSVERVGERMNIHFKCHCGNGYQFLVVDGNCFYKLM